MNKKDTLCATIESLNPDIIGITESWCIEEVTNAEISYENYGLFRRDRGNGRRGGGVLLYVKSELKAVTVKPKVEEAESVWCKLETTGQDLYIGVCYRAPGNTTNDPNTHTNINNIIREFKGKYTMQMGDYNYPGIDWSVGVGDSLSAQTFMNTIEDCGLTQHVEAPTRGNAILDLVLTSEPDMIDNVEILGTIENSDHNLLSWSTEVAVPNRSCKPRPLPDYRKANFALMKEELNKINWDRELSNNAEEDWTRITDIVLELEGKFVPSHNKGKRKKNKWMTNTAVKAVGLKHKTYKKYKNTNHPAYRKAAKKASKEISNAKFNFESKLAKNIKSDSKSFYTYVRSNYKSKVKTGPVMNSDGTSTTSEQEMCDIFNDYFSSVFTKEDISVIPTPGTIFTGSKSDQLSNIQLDIDTVKTRIQSLREDKAPGPQDINPRLLKGLSEELSYPVSIVWTKSIQEGGVPLAWISADVCPMHKKGS